MVFITHCFVIIFLISHLKTSSDIRVYGGTSLKEESNKIFVILKLRVKLGKEIKTCTGSVLNANWIVSAAHCFRYKNIKTVTAEHYENGRFDTIGDVELSKIKIHPKYDEDGRVSAAKHDVALLNLKTSITKFIQLDAELPKIGQKATILGFGEAKYNSEPNEGVVVIQRTKNIISTFGNIWGSHGDSGGALVMEGRLVGIVSRRKCKAQCTTYYSDVYSNYKWIQRVMNYSV